MNARHLIDEYFPADREPTPEERPAEEFPRQVWWFTEQEVLGSGLKEAWAFDVFYLVVEGVKVALFRNGKCTGRDISGKKVLPHLCDQALEMVDAGDSYPVKKEDGLDADYRLEVFVDPNTHRYVGTVD